MVLSNISRSHPVAEQVFDEIDNKLNDLISAFVRIDYNKKKCHLNYLGEFLLIFTSFWLVVDS